MFNKTRRLLISTSLVAGTLILLCLAASVISLFFQGNGVSTPREVVGKGVHIYSVSSGPGELVACRWFCFSGHTASAVVIYSDTDDNGEGTQSYSVALTGAYRGDWHPLLDTQTEDFNKASSQPVSLDIQSIPQASNGNIQVNGHWILVSGQVHQPNVAYVKVTLSNGQMIRDEVTHNTFAFVSRAKGVCEVRAFDGNNRILQRIDRTKNPALSDCK